jgi:hypothetical protein
MLSGPAAIQHADAQTFHDTRIQETGDRRQERGQG